MSTTQLVIAGDDARLGRALQAHLREGAVHPPTFCPFGAIRPHLGPHANRILVCAAAGAADAAQIVRLVQDVRLQQWPCAILLVESPEVARDGSLARLDPYVDCRLVWPEQATLLLGLTQFEGLLGTRHGTVRGRPVRGPSPDADGEGALAEVLARQLLERTPSLLPLAEPLALAAAHDVTVLLTGETGSGKTHLARLIHDNSPRRDQRLLVIPCGALAPSLVESEFFGHARGAFTGADQAKVGKFEAAGAGTILLDEVDTLGHEQQAKLLRVIETGEFEPVGSNDTRRCAARLIAASNLDLEAAVAAGKFRQDLYYRLNVLALHLPPLRERVQDVGPLARGMAARFAGKFGKGLFGISPEALALVEGFAWPGNIRQLENVMQQAVLASAGPELLPRHLPAPVREGTPRAPTRGLAQGREQQERATIQQALAAAGNCRSRAARALGVSRMTLYNKMKKYHLAKNVPQLAGIP
jgi:two-component system response regulator HydG